MLFFKVNNEFYIKLSKAKDLSRLVKKVIVDKNGHRKTVYVKIYDIESKKKQLNKFIESIRKEKIEHSLVIDANHNVILYKSGDRDSVRYTKNELRKINNSKLAIHNHTNGSSFSNHDIKFLSINKIHEVKVVGIINGNKFDYSLKLLKQFSENEIRELDIEYSIIERDVYNRLMDKIHNNEIKKDDAINNFRHYVMTKFVDKHKENIKYERNIKKSK